jgi:hypothetical protein
LREAGAGINVAIDDEEALVKAISLFVDMDETELGTWSEAAYLYSERMVDVEKVRREYEEMFGIIDN